MGNSVYQINRGVGKPVEFKGLKAQYIWYLGGGLVALLVLFAILYIAGVPIFLCLPITVNNAGDAKSLKPIKHEWTVHGTVPPLMGFYNSIADDARISATHISLYMALLQQWNTTGGLNPFPIQRDSIMKAAKISVRVTYNRCMNNNLNDYGYITYFPCVNSFRRSTV